MSRLFVRAGITVSIALSGVVGIVGLTRGAELLALRTSIASPPVDTMIAKAFRWRSVGPDRGGRSIAIAGVKGQPKISYFGAAGGGLWKTTDGGAAWTPVTDG